MRRPPVPVIGIPACVRDLEYRPFHGVGERYVLAVAEVLQAIPILIPAIGKNANLHCNISAILDQVDALLLPGSSSMVDPEHYGCSRADESWVYDDKRDATTLPLIREAVKAGKPVLGICRGTQEMNVAFGGTLHQQVHLLPGHLDHRDRGFDVSMDIRFAEAHTVHLTPGGLLSDISPVGREFAVNSLHTQSVDRLGKGLVAEAVACDGVIEAIRVEGAPAFAMGVQWHPEWRIQETPFSNALFHTFLSAAQTSALARQGRAVF
jgi:putative glutamine amidotransferase